VALPTRLLSGISNLAVHGELFDAASQQRLGRRLMNELPSAEDDRRRIAVVETKDQGTTFVLTDALLNRGWTVLPVPRHKSVSVKDALLAAGFRYVARTTSAGLSIGYFEDKERSFSGAVLPGLCFSTSGTTGLPKLVPFDINQVNFIGSAVGEVLCYQADDIVLSPLPVGFDYGFYQAVLAARASSSLAFADAVTFPADFVSSAQRLRATVLPVTPALARRILAVLDSSEERLTDVRMVTSTGSDLPPGLVARLQTAMPNAQIVPMYGMTECKRISISTAASVRRFPGSCGLPLPGTQVEIVESSEAIAAPDGVGEIVVSGPHVTLGYLGSTEPTGGVLRTGDLGRMGSDGELYHLGRLSVDFVKFHDERVGLLDIERTIGEVLGHRSIRIVPRRATDGSVEGFDVEHESALESADVAAVERVVHSMFGSHVSRALRLHCVDSIALTENGKVVRE